MAIARGEITITELYDGDNFYRAWADTPDGSGSSFTTEESDRAYLGVYSGREEPTHYSQYKWSRIRGESAITAILSNDSHQIGTDENGNNQNYTGAKTTVAVFHGGEDDTSNWEIDSIQVEPAGAVAGEIVDTYTYKVKSMTEDEASVIFRLTHKKGEYSPLEKTFTLSKNKQGISGQHATSYYLSFNGTAVKKFRETGTMEPAQLMMQGMSITADKKPVPQSGYFKIYEQSEIALDRDQYEQAYVDKKLDEEELYVISEKNYPLILTYTSKEPEERLTYEYTDLINIMSIKVYWYRDADFEELIDVQTISVTSDGEKGDPGENAPLIKLSGDTQVIKISEDGVKTPSSDFTITGKSLNADIEKWEYAVNGGSFSTNLPAGVARSNDIVTINPGLINFNTLSIQATGAGVSDTFTIAQMADGLNAYTVLLSNESHTFQADTQKAVASSARTDILAYRGTKRMPVSIQSVTGLPTGMTHTVSNNGKYNASINFNATTSLTSPSGLVSINLTIDGQQITKEFSYALSFKGDTGESGKDAISAVLTNESITFAADKEGVVQNYVGNTGNFLLMEGTVNQSAGTNFSIVSQTNVTATINTNGSYTISSMTNGTSVTTGQVTFRAVYKETTIDKTVTISKSIAGQTGAQGNPGAPGGKGDPGASATSYWLTSSVDTITVKYNGDYDPKTITYYGHSKTGSNNTQNYAGRFIIQTSVDGVNFKQAYLSSTNMNKVDFSVPEDVLFIKAKFYQAGGTTYLLDEQTTPILHSADGLKGVGLEDKDYQVGTEIFTDKADDSVMHVDIDGKSYQHAGSGKNLLEGNWDVSWDNDAGVHNRYNYLLRPNIISIKDKVKVGDTLTFSFDVWAESNFTLEVYDRNGNPSMSFGSHNIPVTSGAQRVSFTSTLSSSTSTSSIWYLDLYNGNNGVKFSVKNIQIEKGSSATAYEPPVPTPDYPIEIHSLNDFDVVSSVGKENLLSNSTFGRYIGGRLENYDDRHYRLLNDIYYIYENPSSSLIGFEFPNPKENITFSGLTSYPSIIVYYRGYNKNGDTTVPQKSFPISVHNGEFRSVERLISNDDTDYYILGIGVVGDKGNNGWIKPKLEKGSTSTPYSPSPEDITEDTNHPLIDKINLSLSEPLRSVGDVKDRLFRDDSDGLWKIERNVGELILDGNWSWILHTLSTTEIDYYEVSLRLPNPGHVRKIESTHFSGTLIQHHYPVNHIRMSAGGHLNVSFKHGTFNGLSAFKDWLDNNHIIANYEIIPEIETLDQELQDKLNNLRSFQDSNYVYTIINNKTNILSENLKPTLHTTFKGGGYYARWKAAYDLEKTTEYIEQEIKRTQNTAWIRAGMRVGYSGFTQTNPNSVYICGLEYRDGHLDMVMVDKPAEIYIRDSEQTDTIPNQALFVTGIPAGTTAYIIWDNTKKELFFIYYESVMTSTGVSRKRWRNISGQTIEFTDSLFAIGEVEV